MNEDRAANAGDDCDDRDPEKYILLWPVLIVVSVRSFEKPNESELGGKKQNLSIDSWVLSHQTDIGSESG